MLINTYQVGPIDTNNYLVSDKESKEAILIDCSGYKPEIIQDVNEMGLNVKYILITHGHFDHVLGINKMKEALGAEVYVPTEDIILIENINQFAKQFAQEVESIPKYDKNEKLVTPTFSSHVVLENEALDIGAPYFTLREIRNVKNGPSPKWMQDRLTAVGLRPISALVDVTNYFNIAFGRPLHVFDADKVKGKITVRSAKDGEKLLALDGREYALSEGMVVIAYENGV